MSPISGAPKTCMFPECPEPPRWCIQWWDLATDERRRVAICTKHIPHVGILAPTEEPTPLVEMAI